MEDDNCLANNSGVVAGGCLNASFLWQTKTRTNFYIRLFREFVSVTIPLNHIHSIVKLLIASRGGEVLPLNG